jgi:hypothetical protein
MAQARGGAAILALALVLGGAAGAVRAASPRDPGPGPAAGRAADAGPADAASGDAAVGDGAPADAPRPRNDAGEELPETVTISVGKHAELRLGFTIIEARCDDPDVVRVEDGGDHLRLVGLAVGQTLCGFWKEKHPRPHRLVQVVVVPEKAPPRRRDGGAADRG